MNKLYVDNNGGMPFYKTDFNFIDEAVRDAFKGLFSNYGLTASDGFRISGCVVTQSGVNPRNFSWTDGYIYYLGEILKVVAGNLTTDTIPWGTGKGLYWDIDLSWNSTGNRAFYSGGSHDCYQVRNGILKFGTLPSPCMPMQAPYIKDKLIDSITISDLLIRINAYEEPWNAATLLNSWANYTNVYEAVSYKIDLFGVVWLKGYAVTGNNTLPIFNLPIGYRPTKKRKFFGGLNPSTADPIFINIAANGDVSLEVAGVNASFDGISFKL